MYTSHDKQSPEGSFDPTETPARRGTLSFAWSDSARMPILLGFAALLVVVQILREPSFTAFAAGACVLLVVGAALDFRAERERAWKARHAEHVEFQRRRTKVEDSLAPSMDRLGHLVKSLPSLLGIEKSHPDAMILAAIGDNLRAMVFRRTQILRRSSQNDFPEGQEELMRHVGNTPEGKVLADLVAQNARYADALTKAGLGGLVHEIVSHHSSGRLATWVDTAPAPKG